MAHTFPPSHHGRTIQSDAPRRHALMICYFFPPIVASGTTRSQTFAEHLPAFGWQPTVLTVGRSRDPWVNYGGTIPENVKIVRSSELPLARWADTCHGAASRLYRLAGRDLKTNYFRELWCLPDAQLLWWSTVPGLRPAACSDLIYASCSPFSSAVSAALLGRLTKKPVVVDFRDAWSLNPHWRHTAIHRAAAARLERLVLRSASRVILNTDGAGRLYRRTFPELERKFVVIPNGYDDLTPIIRSDPPPERFTIVHLGSFYGERSPDLLLEALAELQHLPIDFLQVGGSFPSAERFRDRVRMEILPPLPRPEALKMLERASLLYLKQGFEHGVTDYIAVAAKTYEYLATGLPILAETPAGDNADIVDRYGAVRFVITEPKKELLRAAVVEAYEKRNDPPAGISSEFIERFDRRSLTRNLAQLFDEVLEERRAR